MFGEPMEEFDLVRCPTLPYELPLSAVAGALERCEIGRFLVIYLLLLCHFQIRESSLVVYKTSLTCYFASTFSSQQGYRRI
jgi:hypothetical protein